MPRSRSTSPGRQEGRPYEYQPRGRETGLPPGTRRLGSRPGLDRLPAGAGLCAGVLLFGEVVKSGPVSRFDLRIDQLPAYDRSSTLTSPAKFATNIGVAETVGVALMIGVPVMLFLIRRGLGAVKVFCMFAGAYALIEIVKKIVSEPRPQAALQAVAVDSGGLFPSGHASVGFTLCIELAVIDVTFAGRATALVLGDHYPLDVAGSLLCAAAAALVVTGLAVLPILQSYLRRLERAPPPDVSASAGPDTGARLNRVP